MRDYLSIGSSPCDEDCAQLGTPDYYERARKECIRFISLIRKACGEEPELSTAQLKIKSNPHDFGTYLDVVVEFDDQDELAVEYALWVESHTPQTWDDDHKSLKFAPKKQKAKVS